MRWIKHPSSFSRSAAMTDVLETLGPAGYGATWLLLERIAGEWDGKTEPKLQLSLKSWKNTCGLSPKKLRDLLETLENYGVIFSENSENKLSLTAPILLELFDEWTSRNRKNSGDTPEPLPSNSRIQTEQQSEIYKEQNMTHPPPTNMRKNLVAVLERHGISPGSERGRRIIRYIEQKRPKNPGGYLVKILREKPHFESEMSEVPGREQTSGCDEGPVSVQDILSKIGLPRKEQD